jgi:hypothetical protein
MADDLTPEEERAIEEFAKEVATGLVDAMFIKAGLMDEPTTELGKKAYARAMRGRDPFDNVCACEYESETRVCVCTRRKLDDRVGPCSNCMSGQHRLRPIGG